MFQNNEEKKEDNLTNNNEMQGKEDEAGVASAAMEQQEGNKKVEDNKIKERLSELENQYLRILADYQNLQKRTQAEKEELYKYASQKTIEILLPALDTFDYARQSVKPDSNVDKVVEDFNLVFEMLLKCLKDIGLEPIEETGVPFDPFIHEPLHQIPTDELPDHTIMQILKRGYRLNNKVIRPALVAVSIKARDKNPTS